MTASSSLSNHRKGSLRDRSIVEAVERHKVLDAEQIRLMFFGGINQGKVVARRRLRRLVKLNRLKRGRHEICEPYHYYIERPGQIEHALAVNWVYVWLSSYLKRWEQMHCYNLEVDYRVLRADAFAAIKNTVSGNMRFYFVEIDLSKNPFDKAQKYNALYTSEKYLSAWWVPLTKRFPAILIFTTTEARRNTIKKEIDRHNAAGLEFRVYLLSHIREECLARGQSDSAGIVSV